MPRESERERSPDYAKLSLYLGAVSIVGAGLYAYWQIRRAETEMRYRAKYEEAKNAIRQVQQAYGLQPTGKLDEPTRALFSRLGAAQ
jgi:cytochrome oxidase assembly protein ShyY1